MYKLTEEIIFFISLFLFKNFTFFGNGAPHAPQLKIFKEKKTNEKFYFLKYSTDFFVPDICFHLDPKVPPNRFSCP